MSHTIYTDNVFEIIESIFNPYLEKKEDKIMKKQDLTKVHQANILKSLEHRLEVARAKGETNLIQQLEAEKRYFNS